MRHPAAPAGALSALVFTLLFSLSQTVSIQPGDLPQLRKEVSDMFYHGYRAYMNYGFPADEIKPLSCEPRYRTPSGPSRGDLDDVLGRFALTLVDSADTLAALGDWTEFAEAVKLISLHVKFDNDIVVSVFETNIRVLGGLLSSHMLAQQHLGDGYDGSLLSKAVDLGNRLLTVFDTSTGIPRGRVNLNAEKLGSGARKPLGHSDETCTACAGTLILEFGTLSRLTGDPKFERAAMRAFAALFDKRSSLDLLGNVINTNTGLWSVTHSHIGAGIDSFFEYAFKAWILFGNEEFYEMFNKSYLAIEKHMKYENGWYLPVDMLSGQMRYSWADSLSAFWPGLQVLIGDVEGAKRSYDKYHYLWKKYRAGIPERYDVLREVPTLYNYPLRPEFIESTYFLYLATKDPFYLGVGKMVLDSLKANCKVPCGYASIENLETMKLEDRMDSYFLAETCKYLYLLFDPDNFLNTQPYIFTTEGHPFPINKTWFVPQSSSNDTYLPKKAAIRVSSDQCERPELGVGLWFPHTPANARHFGKPLHQRQQHPNNPPTPQEHALRQLATYKLTGLNREDIAQVLVHYSQFDNVFALNPTVECSSGQKLSFANFSKETYQSLDFEQQDSLENLKASFSETISLLRPIFSYKGNLNTNAEDLSANIEGIQVYTFNGEQSNGQSPGLVPFSSTTPPTLCEDLATLPSSEQGEIATDEPPLAGGFAVIERGGCTFAEKIRRAQQFGALGAIISNNQNTPIFTMTGDASMKNIVQEILIPAFMISQTDGTSLRRLLTEVEPVDLISLCNEYAKWSGLYSANDRIDALGHFDGESATWPTVKLQLRHISTEKSSTAGLQFIIKLSPSAPSGDVLLDKLGGNAFLVGEDVLVIEEADLRQNRSPEPPSDKLANVNILLEQSSEARPISIKRADGIAFG